jgi:hypothetical protein
VVPPPTPPKARQPPIKVLKTASEPALAGYLLPAPIMAAVREHIETISFQERLTKKEMEIKKKYADWFLLRLPDTTNDVPDHIYHRIWLKNPILTVEGCGYSVPKKYQEPWKSSWMNTFRLAKYVPLHLNTLFQPFVS